MAKIRHSNMRGVPNSKQLALLEQAYRANNIGGDWQAGTWSPEHHDALLTLQKQFGLQETGAYDYSTNEKLVRELGSTPGLRGNLLEKRGDSRLVDRFATVSGRRKV